MSYSQFRLFKGSSMKQISANSTENMCTCSYEANSQRFGLIPVRSAFGGFEIYQTIYLNNCTYEIANKNHMEKSKHISFYDCVIKNGGKIFINPKFQNADGLKKLFQVV